MGLLPRAGAVTGGEILFRDPQSPETVVDIATLPAEGVGIRALRGGRIGMGYSFEYQRPVREIVGDRLILTMMVSFATIIFTWVVAFPIGIYSATHQYSWGDYGLTFLGLLGIAIPNFMPCR